MPLEFPGVRIERDHRVRVEVVSGPAVAVPVGAWIADTPVHQVQIGVVRAGDPDRTTASLPGLSRPRLAPRFARRRDRIEAPQLLPRLRIEGEDVSANPVLAAGGTHDQL